MFTDNYLRHYGVLGMHWGKSGKKSTIKKAKPKIVPSEDHKKKVALKGKKVHELSNDQIRELTTRLQLERQVRDLNPSDMQKGLNAVKKVTAAGTTVASLYALSKTPLFQDLAKTAKKVMK